MTNPIYDIKEKNYLDYTFSNETLFIKVFNILEPHYFQAPLNHTVRFTKEYFEKYQNLPPFDILKAETGVDFEHKQLGQSEFDFILDEIESHCKGSAFQKAILDNLDDIEQGNFGNAEQRIREALTISVDTDLGLNIFENPVQRLLMMQENIDAIPLGWKDFDNATDYIKRGEIVLFAGGSGSGKSVVLTNIANLLAKRGLNVLYLSLELKDALVAKRFDSIITGIPIKGIFDDLAQIESIYQRIKHGYGDLTVKKLPVGSTSNMIRSYLLEYQLQNGFIPDVILVDHLDLMEPNNSRSGNNGVFDKDKAVTEEVREIFIDYNTYGFSASQLNRDSISMAKKSQGHIAGGLSKINTSDVVVAISRTEEQIDSGELELQFLKLRNASMSTAPILMAWDDNTLEISDMSNAVAKKLKTGQANKTNAQFSQKNELMDIINKSKNK